MAMEVNEVLRIVGELVRPYGLSVDWLGVYSVGVAGDYRTYRPVLLLSGPHPGDDILAEVSTRIGNMTEGCRVTFEIAVRKES